MSNSYKGSSFDSFLEAEGLSRIIEQRHRIQLSVYALAYERYNYSLIPDDEYDKLSYQINLSIPTDRPDLDQWFKDNYVPYSGSWVNSHPELTKLSKLTEYIIHLHKSKRL